MKSSLRYSLIILGIVAFLIATPFIVLFVSGVHYDFKTNSFVRTGILSAKTNPKGATVYLNNKAAGRTQISIRFLDPGDYDVVMKKQGYFDWSKRLNIKRSYVTNTNLNLSAVTLYFSSPKIKNMAENVLNFYSGDHRIIYLSSNQLYLADTNTPQKIRSLQLPSTLVSPQIISAPNENYYLILDNTVSLIFDVTQNKIVDITKLLPKYNNIQLTSSGQIFVLVDNELQQILWQNGNVQNLANNVVSFANDDGSNLYLLQTDSTGDHYILNSYDLGSSQFYALGTNLQTWNQAQLYLSPQKQIFINGDGTLYYFGQDLTAIAKNVQSVVFYGKFGKMLYATNNEIDLYDNFDGTTGLVTRSSQTITNPLADLGAGYIFYINDDRIQNIELDARDHQNNYTFANISTNAKFYLSADGLNLFLLDAGKLSELRIR